MVLDIKDGTTILSAPSVKQCMDDILNMGVLFHEYYFLAYQNTLFSDFFNYIMFQLYF